MGNSIIIPAILGIFVFTVLITSSMGSADAAIFMQYGDIKGESTAKDHDEWINVESFQFGVSREFSSSGGSGGGRTASNPNFQEISVTKETDKTTPEIFGEAVAGKNALVTIDFTQSCGSAGQITYLRYVLTNTQVSSFNISGSGSSGDTPTENLSLNYQKIEMTFFLFSDDGFCTSKGIVEAGYDLVSNKPV